MIYLDPDEKVIDLAASIAAKRLEEFREGWMGDFELFQAQQMIDTENRRCRELLDALNRADIKPVMVLVPKNG
jgi:DnaJ-domain-containing protein 1